ncbi:hypothetical protein SERLADRAFT_434783 [Serpula lacrymans var. lacrymans S7.9]|uniref:Uncharacterized protein n=1 Tax=Serpula lacrymans var. lacrymans (strain S7.9) TaxID=578457 RepID=F8NL72_SERL9|nr:uncharacterized protein SERLADRAFT_434783 [Serpula lacrymans var. lacrymans S7.9]EGO28888.1 hypothetical protein SERLADRAFT_434783 [Serpula lacrymans var. lacrymans S7.9]
MLKKEIHRLISESDAGRPISSFIQGRELLTFKGSRRHIVLEAASVTLAHSFPSAFTRMIDASRLRSVVPWAITQSNHQAKLIGFRSLLSVRGKLDRGALSYSLTTILAVPGRMFFGGRIPMQSADFVFSACINESSHNHLRSTAPLRRGDVLFFCRGVILDQGVIK